MAFKIVWTERAITGYDNIIRYLEANFSDREVRSFVTRSEDFFAVLSTQPGILQRFGKNKNVHRGPLNRLTILTYRVKPNKKEIELINIRGARQKPLKR